MGYTAFGASQTQFKRAWVAETIKSFRQQSFWEKFMGKDANNIVQRITELKKTDKGDRAMIGLKANMKEMCIRDRRCTRQQRQPA